jgi:hypothetical protein
MRSLFLSLFFLVACDSSTANTSDLSLPDLKASSDLAAPAGDLAGTCYQPQLSIACGSDTCGGAKPYCCRWGTYAQFEDAYCSATPACNFGDGFEPSQTIVDRCDDAADCPDGQLCCDAESKGPTHRAGAYCAADCSVFAYGIQLCTKNCECASGSCDTHASNGDSLCSF